MFFNSFHTRLPLPTRMLVNSANFLTAWWPVIVGVGLLAGVSFVVAWRKPASRFRIDRVVLRLPVVGKLLRFSTVVLIAYGGLVVLTDRRVLSLGTDADAPWSPLLSSA